MSGTSFGRDVAYLHGGTPKKRRDEMVARFQSGDGPSIFLLSLKAGGTGLNLTAANHVVHLDRWWNPAVENQATDRAFRIGQQRTVQVRKFICTGTLEEKIDDMIEEKKALADLVVTDGEGWLTELSTRDLREVFALARRDVEVAVSYTLALQETGAPRGIVSFTALPIRLARAALDRVEHQGPGAKLTRDDVAEILAAT